MVTRWKVTSPIHFLLPVLVLCVFITNCAPTLVSPTEPSSSLVIGRVVIDNKHSGRHFGALPLGTVDQGIEVEIESHDGSQYFKSTTEKKGYFYFPNIPPNNYHVRHVLFKGTMGNQTESYSLTMRRLNFTPITGKVIYIGTLFIKLTEQAKSKIREVRDAESARAYFRDRHEDSAWASREFIPVGARQVPSTQVAKGLKEQPRGTKSDTGPSVKAQKPEWEIGYWWKYKWERPDRSGTLTKKIVREESFDGIPCFVIKVRRSESFYTKDVLGLLATKTKGKVVLKRDAPFKPQEWPLKVGKKWKNVFTMERPKEESSANFELEVVVAKIEEVTVPAGKFKAFKIDIYNSRSGELELEWWYSPKVKWYVKKISYKGRGSRPRKEMLISYKIQ